MLDKINIFNKETKNNALNFIPLILKLEKYDVDSLSYTSHNSLSDPIKDKS